jgi:hypothetical protein|tara:strand:- start:2290 stop:2907 length:618 start_codon:yes stop_codon:yes gene_type:complete
MPKKCPPGVICLENLTFVLLCIIGFLVFYLIYMNALTNNKNYKKVVVQKQLIPQNPLVGISTRNDVFNDPYAPPLKDDGMYFRRDSSDIRGHPPIQVPVNIETRGLTTNYSQLGILTVNNGVGDNLILPLMGRRHMAGRDKWQYYTISNTGSLNTKLPISVNGKSCSSEYGCDPITNNASVYVEGYKDTFQATIYENSTFHYLPY